MANRVIVVPYDPDWPRRFDEERSVLAAVFARSEAIIEHVGSTAVQGLGAKPVIDMMVGLPALVEVEGRIPTLDAAGYEYVQEYEKQLPERRYLRKRDSERVHFMCIVSSKETIFGFAPSGFATIFVLIRNRPRPITT